MAFTVFAVLVGLSRTLATSPLPVRFSAVTPEAFRSATAAALGTALSLGVLAGLGCIAIGLWIGGVGGNAVLALGVILPGLLVQDSWRQVFFAEGRPAAAALNSAVWAVAQFAAVAALLLSDRDTVVPLVLAWGGAAVAAAVLGIRQGRVLPRPARTRTWLRDHRDLTRYVIAEFGAQQGAMQGSLLLIGVLGSLAAIGSVRGTLVLLGLTSILAMAAVSFALPEFSRRRATLTERQWILGAAGLSALVGGVGVLWGLACLLAPDSFGRALLGETWDSVSEVLLAAAVSQAILAGGIGPSTMLRAMDRASVTFWRHAVMSPLILAGGVAGVVLGGAEGAFWGWAIAYALGQPLWWFLLRREAKALVARGGRFPAEDRPGPSSPQPHPAGGHRDDERRSTERRRPCSLSRSRRCRGCRDGGHPRAGGRPCPFARPCHPASGRRAPRGR